MMKRRGRERRWGGGLASEHSPVIKGTMTYPFLQLCHYPLETPSANRIKITPNSSTLSDSERDRSGK